MIVACDIMEQCKVDDDNDDNMMCGSVWYIYGGYFNVMACDIQEGHVTTRRGV